MRAGSALRRTSTAHRRGAARRAARSASLRLVADGGRLVPQEPGRHENVGHASVRTPAARQGTAARREIATRATAAARTSGRLPPTPVRLTRRGAGVLTAPPRRPTPPVALGAALPA